MAEGAFTTSSAYPRVIIAGGSGFLGLGLAMFLRERSYGVVLLSRNKPRIALPVGVMWRAWDNQTLGDWAAELDGARAVVNLVGRSVDCRKTTENKRVILESRMDSCRVLGEAVRTVSMPPPVWIQSATAHIIGDPQPVDVVCDESTPPGPMHEMAPFVGVEWEKAFNAAKLPEQRGVIMRISFVLGPRLVPGSGGAFERLQTMTKFGLGGTVGSGRQWMSWIHQRDLNRLIMNAIEDESYRGVYMVTSPEPVTNREFMKVMRGVHRRPWSPPAPSIGVRLACRFLLNTDPELALLGRRCVPRRLREEYGFVFEFPSVEQALRDLAD